MKKQNPWDSEWVNHKGLNLFGRLRIRQLAGAIIKNIPKLKEYSSFLDMGIGVGDLSEALKKAGYKQRGIDNSEIALKICRKKGLNAERGDVFNTRFADNSFGFTITDGLLEHFKNREDAKKIIKEQIRVAKHFIVISMPSTTRINTIYRAIHVYGVKEYRIPFKEFKQMLKSFDGISICKCGHYNFSLFYYFILKKK